MKIMKPKSYMCRFYILEGVNIVTDSDDVPELFLKVKINGKEEDLEAKTLRQSANPMFYILYEFPLEIPGPSYIELSVWIKGSFGDSEKIGFTEIDLEDRYFSVMWHKYELKPIELRNLHQEDGSSVGRIKMWVDLV